MNDTFGTAMKNFPACCPFNMPVQISSDAYDLTARDLRSRWPAPVATGAEALLVVSRLNDAILLTRELVKQR